MEQLIRDMARAFEASLVAIMLVGFSSFSMSSDDVANPIEPKEVADSVNQLRENLHPEIQKELKRLEEKYPQESTTGPSRYQRSGHQFTTYIIAVLAGYPLDRAHRLAYFSQYPDDKTKYSAVAAAFYFWNWTYRRQIMADLHSLHGGNREAVLRRREVLKSLLSKGVQEKRLEDYQLGLIIHAFADAYAHVKGEGETLAAFGSGVGHLFHGHEPDIIAYAPDRYREFVCELFAALATKDTCSPELDRLIAMIDNLSVVRDNELPNFENFAVELYFDENLYLSEGEKSVNMITEDDVDGTVDLISDAVKE